LHDLLHPFARRAERSPAVWCDVEHELYVIGSAAEFATERDDWVMRVLDRPRRPATGGPGAKASSRPRPL